MEAPSRALSSMSRSSSSIGSRLEKSLSFEPNQGTGKEMVSRARNLLREIESLIQKELDSISSDNTHREHLSPGSKRKRSSKDTPRLIKQLNKKKSKIIYGEMIFDPIDKVWRGNEDELRIFERKTPAPGLIQNPKHLQEQVQTIGEMTYDPREKKWRGNERDLKKFNFAHRPNLITPSNMPNLLPGVSHLPSIVSHSRDLVQSEGGMKFDSEAMVWRGNDETLDIFKDIEESEEKHGAFAVGQEFSLSVETIQSFKKSEEEFQKELHGWCGNEYDNRKHLYAVRSMALLRIVAQAKQVVTTNQQNTSTNSQPPTPQQQQQSTLTTSTHGAPSQQPQQPNFFSPSITRNPFFPPPTNPFSPNQINPFAPIPRTNTNNSTTSHGSHGSSHHVQQPHHGIQTQTHPTTTTHTTQTHPTTPTTNSSVSKVFDRVKKVVVEESDDEWKDVDLNPSVLKSKLTSRAKSSSDEDSAAKITKTLSTTSIPNNKTTTNANNSSTPNSKPKMKTISMSDFLSMPKQSPSNGPSPSSLKSHLSQTNINAPQPTPVNNTTTTTPNKQTQTTTKPLEIKQTQTQTPNQHLKPTTTQDTEKQSPMDRLRSLSMDLDRQIVQNQQVQIPTPPQKSNDNDSFEDDDDFFNEEEEKPTPTTTKPKTQTQTPLKLSLPTKQQTSKHTKTDLSEDEEDDDFFNEEEESKTTTPQKTPLKLSLPTKQPQQQQTSKHTKTEHSEDDDDFEMSEEEDTAITRKKPQQITNLNQQQQPRSPSLTLKLGQQSNSLNSLKRSRSSSKESRDSMESVNDENQDAKLEKTLPQQKRYAIIPNDDESTKEEDTEGLVIPPDFNQRRRFSIAPKIEKSEWDPPEEESQILANRKIVHEEWNDVEILPEHVTRNYLHSKLSSLFSQHQETLPLKENEDEDWSDLFPAVDKITSRTNSFDTFPNTKSLPLDALDQIVDDDVDFGMNSPTPTSNQNSTNTSTKSAKNLQSNTNTTTQTQTQQQTNTTAEPHELKLKLEQVKKQTKATTKESDEEFEEWDNDTEIQVPDNFNKVVLQRSNSFTGGLKKGDL